ncbi:hypothetical protein [Muriicola sp. Z0-33]|nr:hypothetical protein [Muriicola sp. Z0-33]
MREEVVRTKEVYKSCFFVGCAAVIIFILIAVIYFFLWPYSLE